MTALLVACLQGNAADAEFLLELGADPDSRRIFQAFVCVHEQLSRTTFEQ